MYKPHQLIHLGQAIRRMIVNDTCLFEFRINAVIINQFKTSRYLAIFILMKFDLVMDQVFFKKRKAESILYSVVDTHVIF